MLLILHPHLYTPDAYIEDAAILIQDGRIARIGQSKEIIAPPDSQIIEARGLTLTPGLIDLQINGAFGDDFAAQPDILWRAAAQLPRYGVTAFLPTIVTSPPETIVEAQRVLASRPANWRGAEPLGLHLEGPFLNVRKKGAHNPAHLRAPDDSLAKEWSPQNGVRLVTLAPELPGALDLIRDLAARGILVSAGHSMATDEEAQRGFEAGARYATHLFNAMPPLEARAPGLVGAVLANPAWVAGIIPDGIHVHPDLVKAAWLAKRGALNLVTDAMAGLGMPPGQYLLGDHPVNVSLDRATLRDGTLAGCILSSDAVLRNFIAFTGCSHSDALAAVTTTPARLLGIENDRGRIKEGLIADLLLLDSELNVKMTIARGEIVFSNMGKN